MTYGTNNECIGTDDEAFLLEIASAVEEGEENLLEEAGEDRHLGDTPDSAEEYINRITELEEKLREAEESRERRERELLCLGLLEDAGLSCELAPAVMASEDMEGTVEVIRCAVAKTVEAEILRRCRGDAPLNGCRAPLTREELIRTPVAELQRIRNMGARLT